MRLPLLCLFVVTLLFASARAEEPFFKKNDVIALVGGEDMVVASEYGYLETLLTRTLPDYHLRFRNLAWEGDTVYEQRRELNFPTWEEQLDKIGATVVICQFGQMESLDGTDKIPAFIEAYDKLIQRFRADGKRRIVILLPTSSPSQASVKVQPGPTLSERIQKADGSDYLNAQLNYAKSHNDLAIFAPLAHGGVKNPFKPDNIHLSEEGQAFRALASADALTTEREKPALVGFMADKNSEQIRQLIIAKNRLWFDYWRVENWAFLFGDRTNQPSSRDHRDPSKRWFPAEREEFIPLIEAKEKEIDALAEKLNQK